MRLNYFNMHGFGIGHDLIKIKLKDFINDLDSILLSEIGPEKDPFMFTFMLFDKNAPYCRSIPGYKWIKLESMTRIISDSGISDHDLQDFFDFHYIGDFNAKSLECGGACWRIAHKGPFSRIVYSLNEPYGDYIETWKNQQIYNDSNVEIVKKIENKLWAPLSSIYPDLKDLDFLILQQEISRVEKENEFFSLQILARIPYEIFPQNYPILSTLFDEWRAKFSQLFDEVIFQRKIYSVQLKTAIISILVDSYAHNISAHSLAALKWWIELRYKMLDKRFYVDGTKGLTLKNLQPGEIKITQDLLKDTTEKYYETLGLKDSKNNKNFFSLFDYLQFASPNELSKIFTYSESDEDLCCKDNVGIVSNISKKEKKENYIKPKCFYPRFPVPLDYALFPLLRFLRDKGAFWSGVTRDTAFGGESKSWYQILWEDFANNPLFLGTIAKSEGITKININLAVKKDKNWLKGRFVTIDLSIIDYEEKLFQDPNQKGNHEDLSQNEIKKEDCTFTEECGIDYSKYSKYALVKLGGCFKTFREELSKEDYTVFLPGGVIGEHALFTIFENTLRNIKHYKDEKTLGNIRENGIDFWISIEKDELKLNDGGKRDDKKPPELFKVSLWLEHNTELIKCDDKENLKECLWKKVTDSSLNPILDDNGSPQMGGNSQDKACAAMLFNNKFISVESKEGKRDTDYYPWVHFTTTKSNKHYDPIYDQPENRTSNLIYYKGEKDIKCRFVDEYIKLLGTKRVGYLKKYFYLWKSEDYFVIKNRTYLNGENVARFKFVIISDDMDNKEKELTIQDIRENGIIRLLYDRKNDLINNLEVTIPDKFKNFDNPVQKIIVERLKELYRIWLLEWLKFDGHYSVGLKKDQKTRAMIRIEEEKAVTYLSLKGEFNIPENISINNPLLLSHGGDDEIESCNVRSHGFFWSRYFVNSQNKDPEDLERDAMYDTTKEHLLMELVEILATKVIIFDNRINIRMSSIDEVKRKKVFETMLGLYIREEKLKEGEIIFEQFSKQLEHLNALRLQPLILILHLSYIEKLGYREEDINQFIEEQLKKYFEKDNFIFILTSGRGRDSWRNNLKLEYKLKTMFKPVESLISAVESGISYNDNFDVKYNLIKVIFGS